MKCVAIIAAAGDGKRFSNTNSKLLASIKGKPLLYHTLEKFEKVDRIDKIILVIRANDSKKIEKNIINKANFTKLKSIVFGGSTRQQSVYNGLMEISDNDGIVLIHDGARPFISNKLIVELIENLNNFDGIIPAVPASDTVKKLVLHQMLVEKTVNRDEIWMAQTPQVFRIDQAKKCYQKAIEDNIQFTDDSSIIEYYGGKVAVIKGNEQNIKITTKVDLSLANVLVEYY